MRDATDMIVGELAGAPTLDPLLPAGAIIRQPRLNAAKPAAVYAVWGGVCEPSGTRITWQPLATAQFMPASTPADEPPPESVKTFPAKIRDAKAIP